jgi:hypothetical protein
MDKTDLIYKIVQRTETKLDRHIANKDVHNKLSLKEWGKLSFIIGTICTTATTIATIIVKG